MENPEGNQNGNKNSKEFLYIADCSLSMYCAIVSLKFNCICIETGVLHTPKQPRLQPGLQLHNLLGANMAGETCRDLLSKS